MIKASNIKVVGSNKSKVLLLTEDNKVYLANKRELKSKVKYTVLGEVKSENSAFIREGKDGKPETFAEKIWSDTNRTIGFLYDVEIRLAKKEGAYILLPNEKGAVWYSDLDVGQERRVLHEEGGALFALRSEYAEIEYGIDELAWVEKIEAAMEYGKEYLELLEEESKELPRYGSIESVKKEVAERFARLYDERATKALKLEEDWSVEYDEEERAYRVVGEDGRFIFAIDETTAFWSDVKLVQNFYKEARKTKQKCDAKLELVQMAFSNTKEHSKARYIYGL